MIREIHGTPISKREFYADGGLANPRLFRIMWRGSWRYYRGYK